MDEECLAYIAGIEDAIRDSIKTATIMMIVQQPLYASKSSRESLAFLASLWDQTEETIKQGKKRHRITPPSMPEDDRPF
jgi:ABC-type Na+ transport system ATPase subunit NatA